MLAQKATEDCGFRAKWLLAAEAFLGASGVTRLIEFWTTNGTGGVVFTALLSLVPFQLVTPMYRTYFLRKDSLGG
jgi:hypothetical protein